MKLWGHAEKSKKEILKELLREDDVLRKQRKDEAEVKKKNDRQVYKPPPSSPAKPFCPMSISLPCFSSSPRFPSSPEFASSSYRKKTTPSASFSVSSSGGGGGGINPHFMVQSHSENDSMSSSSLGQPPRLMRCYSDQSGTVSGPGTPVHDARGFLGSETDYSASSGSSSPTFNVGGDHTHPNASASTSL